MDTIWTIFNEKYDNNVAESFTSSVDYDHVSTKVEGGSFSLKEVIRDDHISGNEDFPSEIQARDGKDPSTSFPLSSSPRCMDSVNNIVRAKDSHPHKIDDCSMPGNLEKGDVSNMKLSYTLRSHRGSVAALGLSSLGEDNRFMLYSVGHDDGTIKVYNSNGRSRIRSTIVSDMPIASMSLARSSIQSMMGFTAESTHPVVLIGSYDNFVHAYSVEYGRVLGTMAAHDDAISSVLLPDVGRAGSMRCSSLGWTGSTNCSLVTSSWDGTIRLWDVEEGRGTWGASPHSRFVLNEMEYDCALLSLDTAAGGIIVSGAEDGCVVSWDPRVHSTIWSSSLDKGAVNDVMSLSGGVYVVAVSDGGEIHLLDLRKGGTEVSGVVCSDKALRCIDTDGVNVYVGSDDGCIYQWNLSEKGSKNALNASFANYNYSISNGNVRRRQVDAQSGVTSLCLLNDGKDEQVFTPKQIFAGCENGTIKVLHNKYASST